MNVTPMTRSFFLFLCVGLSLFSLSSRAERRRPQEAEVQSQENPESAEDPQGPPVPPPPPLANAQGKIQTQSPTSNDREKNTSISISGSVFGMYYTEFIPPPTDYESGVLGGFNLDARTIISNVAALFVNTDIDFGQTKYTGALQNGTPLTSPTNDFIFNVEGGGGYPIAVSSSAKLIPYIGFGTHYWDRVLTGVGAYTENYLFFYLPIGLRLESKTSDRFEFAIDASLHINLGGTVQVLLSQLSPPEQNATGSLGSAVGFKLQAPLLFYLATNIRLRVAPYLEYFGIGQGAYFNTYTLAGQFVDQSYEPGSSTFFYGAHIGINFCF
jgi:hypothetical protein